MPIYEYECNACGHKFEKLQKVSDEALTVCPNCDEAKLKKLVSAAAFRLKGGGWYETDFKSDKDTKRNLAEGGKSSSDTPKETSNAKSTESKAETKTSSTTTTSSDKA